jgi:beta propeller repeat protein
MYSEDESDVPDTCDLVNTSTAGNITDASFSPELYNSGSSLTGQNETSGSTYTPPTLPHAFFGSAEINGIPVEDGLEIKATGDGVYVDLPGNPIITGEGMYGGPANLDPKLLVQGDIENGAPLSFFIDGVQAEVCDTGSGAGWQWSYPFHSGSVTGLTMRISNNSGNITGTESILSAASWGTSQEYPAIWEDRVVWTDWRSGSPQIFFYNITSGEELQISTNTTYAEFPDIWDNAIVWQDWRNENYDIYLYNLQTGVETQVTDDSSDQIRPGISGNTIIWEDYRNGESYIYSYDIASGQEKKCTEDPSYEFSPAIYGSTIVWQDWRNENYDIYMYDLATGTETQLTGDPSDQTNPALCEGNVVWEDSRDGISQIYLYNLTTKDEVRISGGNGPYTAPSIHGYYVVYVDESGYFDIILYDTRTSAECSITASENSAEMNPDIWGNRIVWWDGRNINADLDYDVYLYTLGKDMPPLKADFSTNISTGDTPLTIRFSDLSTGSITGYRWDFGDGTCSHEQNPVHSYTEYGTYTPVLIIHNPCQRDAVIKTDIICAGTAPVPVFAANRTCGVAPLTVSFNQSSSGSPSAFHWDFGDGSYSDEQNPVHTYNNPGIYPVCLYVENVFGNSTLEKPGYISVMDGTLESCTFDIDGISIFDDGDSPRAVINISCLGSCIFDPVVNGSLIECIPMAGSGFARINLFSPEGDPFRFQGNDSIAGNLSGVLFESQDIRPFNFTEETGTNCYFNFTLLSSMYPADNGLDIIAFEGATPEDYQIFREIATLNNYAGIDGYAYTLHFTGQNQDTDKKATLVCAVSSDWVKNYGWGDNGTLEINSTPAGAKVFVDSVFRGYSPITVRSLAPGLHNVTLTMTGYDSEDRIMEVKDERDSIHLMRIGDDGKGEVLQTTFLYHDPVRNLDIFKAESPNGFSTFGLVSLYKSGNPFQMIYLYLQNHLRPSGGGGGGYSASVGSAVDTSASPVPTKVAVNDEETGYLEKAADTGIEQEIVPGAGVSEVSGSVPAGTTDGTNAPLIATGAALSPVIFVRNLALISCVVLVAFILYLRWGRREEEK